MVELTINNLIKMIIAVFVIVVVVLGVYFSMKNYIIPYFQGFGFSYNNDVNFGGSKDVCDGKFHLGHIELIDSWDEPPLYYFILGQQQTHIYFEDDGYIKFDLIGRDPRIGQVNGYIIEIYEEYRTPKYVPASTIHGVFIGGIEVCNEK